MKLSNEMGGGVGDRELPSPWCPLEGYPHFLQRRPCASLWCHHLNESELVWAERLTGRRLPPALGGDRRVISLVWPQ